MKNHVPSWEDAQERGFQTFPYSNIPNTTNIYVFILFTGVVERSPEYEEPRDLRSNPFQGRGDDAILPPKGQTVVVVEDLPILDLDDFSNLDCICCLKDHNYSTVVDFAAEGVYYKCLQHKFQVAY